MIQAFGCFYVALACAKTIPSGVLRELIGGVLAITNPQTGLLVGIVISFICEWLLTKDLSAKRCLRQRKQSKRFKKKHNTAPRC